MPETWQLKRTVQCAKCPWKVSTNPHEIPGGYCEQKHHALASTIADRHNSLSSLGEELKVMACHHSTPGAEEHCIGWVHNQVGRGNNILLRLQMISCSNAHLIQVKGEQHAFFEDTLPR